MYYRSLLGVLTLKRASLARVHRNVNTQELLSLKLSIDRSLELIGEKPDEPGFEQDMYEQLVRMRTLLRQVRPELFKDE